MLKYVGGGFIPGVPARDLSDEDLKELAEKLDRKDIVQALIHSGLYEKDDLKVRRVDNGT